MQDLIDAAPDREIASLLCTAIRKVFENDLYLLEINAHERTICAHLAGYLKELFTNWHVDVEYNRSGVDPKKIGIGEVPESIFPDIIIHKRGSKDNLLVLELKKGESLAPDQRDIIKLEAIAKTYGYRYSVFIRLSGRGPRITCMEWV